MAEPSYYLGVDLGSTKTAVALWAVNTEVDLTGVDAPGPERVSRHEWPTLPGGAEPNIGRIIKACRALVDGSPQIRVRRLGISGGGPVDPARGLILTIPNQPGWDDVPLAARLSEALSVEAALENDANACAVAEWRYGAGRGARDVAFLTCSTGIGAGLILDGRLYRGASESAGEVGHVVVEPDGAEWPAGVRGCLEAYASGAGMARRLAERTTPEGKASLRSAKDVIDAARAGDRFSIDFLDETAAYLARGLATLIFVVNPNRIVLGTIVAAAGELLLRPLRSHLRKLVWPHLLESTEVVPSQLWPDLGDYAALSVARKFHV